MLPSKLALILISLASSGSTRSQCPVTEGLDPHDHALARSGSS